MPELQKHEMESKKRRRKEMKKITANEVVWTDAQEDKPQQVIEICLESQKDLESLYESMKGDEQVLVEWEDDGGNKCSQVYDSDTLKTKVKNNSLLVWAKEETADDEEDDSEDEESEDDSDDEYDADEEEKRVHEKGEKEANETSKKKSWF